MKHEENVKKRLEHHKRMVELLSKHNPKSLDKKRKKNVEGTYNVLEEYEFVLQKKKSVKK